MMNEGFNETDGNVTNRFDFQFYDTTVKVILERTTIQPYQNLMKAPRLTRPKSTNRVTVDKNYRSHQSKKGTLIVHTMTASFCE